MRDHWLWQIQLKLRERGVWEEIRSVAHLRELYPNLPRPLNNAALERLSIEVEMANLEDWATVPAKKPDRPQARRSRITYEEIRERRSNGESLGSIALAAEISPERVRQICSLNI